MNFSAGIRLIGEVKAANRSASLLNKRIETFKCIKLFSL